MRVHATKEEDEDTSCTQWQHGQLLHGGKYTSLSSRAIVITKTKTKTIALRSVSTKTRTIAI